MVAELLVLKFLLVSDVWLGPPCGCCITGPEIFTSVRVLEFYKCQIFRWVPPVVAELLVLKFLLVSDFRWGPLRGCSFFGLEIFTSVTFSMGSPLWLLNLWSWNFYKCSIQLLPSGSLFFKRSFLRQIAAVRVHFIKYQSVIFSQGFQNCPQIWNWSTRDRVMALPAPFFPALIFMSNRHHTSTFYKISINDFFPRIPKLPSDVKLVH